jgi:sensor domain CHASE-containing protein
MRLLGKILSALLTVVALYAAFVYDVQRNFVYPQFLALELDEARQDVERCREAIVQEIDQLTGVCSDWSSSEDVQRFFAEDDGVHKQSSLARKVFTSGNINLPCLYHGDGQLLWNKTYVS